MFNGRLQVAARLYSTATASVKIPLTLHGIDGRYATALYSAAVKKQQLDTVESELKRIQQVVQKDANLQQFLKNPILGREQKKQGIQSMLGQHKYSDLTQNLFNLLADNRRLDETSKIIDSFLQIMAAHRGEVNVVVTTAKPLDAKLQGRLKDVLAKSSLIKKGDSLKITSKINPSILGGLIVEVGDKSVDLSISSRLAKLNKLITDSI